MSNEPDVTEWAGWDAEAATQDADAASQGGGGGFTYFKPKVGRNVVRFIPARKGAKAMYVTHQHYIEMPGRPKVVFNCPVAMKTGQRCPVCEKVAKLMATGNAMDRDTAFGMKPRYRVYANILDRAEPEKGVQVWGFGKTVIGKLKSLRDDPDVGDFYRPTGDGFDIIVTRTGTTKNDTEYDARPAVKNSPLGDMSFIEVQPDISGLARVPSTEEIVARLKGDEEALKAIRARDRAALEGAQRAANPDPWDIATVDPTSPAGQGY